MNQAQDSDIRCGCGLSQVCTERAHQVALAPWRLRQSGSSNGGHNICGPMSLVALMSSHVSVAPCLSPTGDGSGALDAATAGCPTCRTSRTREQASAGEM